MSIGRLEALFRFWPLKPDPVGHIVNLRASTKARFDVLTVGERRPVESLEF